MKIRLLNLFLIGSVVLSVMLDSCKKSEIEPAKEEIGTFTDSRDSKVYKWVKIGDQVWMAENLDYTGSGIQHIVDADEWENNSDYDGWCYYSNNENNGKTYGVLYQWEAAKSACPNGWHLPTDAEWTKLKQFLNNDGHSGNEGAALKTLSGWENGGEGSDNYGFSALPGGFCSIYGYFSDFGKTGSWWSATESSSGYAYARSLNYDNSTMHRGDGYYKPDGLSVRCVRDY